MPKVFPTPNLKFCISIQWHPMASKRPPGTDRRATNDRPLPYYPSRMFHLLFNHHFWSCAVHFFLCCSLLYRLSATYFNNSSLFLPFFVCRSLLLRDTPQVGDTMTPLIHSQEMDTLMIKIPRRHFPRSSVSASSMQGSTSTRPVRPWPDIWGFLIIRWCLLPDGGYVHQNED